MSLSHTVNTADRIIDLEIQLAVLKERNERLSCRLAGRDDLPCTERLAYLVAHLRELVADIHAYNGGPEEPGDILQLPMTAAELFTELNRLVHEVST